MLVLVADAIDALLHLFHLALEIVDVAAAAAGAACGLARFGARSRCPARANGANIANARSNISMFRRTCSSSAPKPPTPNACAICSRNFSCSRVSESIETSR